jgi:hypothetical protein
LAHESKGEVFKEIEKEKEARVFDRMLVSVWPDASGGKP